MAMVTETRDVRDFDEVVVQGHGDLILEQGDVESVVIEADAAVMPHVKATVEGSRLVLGLEHWWDHLMFPVAPLRFRVSAVTVKRVTISGSGTVKAEAFRSDDLRLEGIDRLGRYGVRPVDGRSGFAGHLRRRQDGGGGRGRKRGRARQAGSGNIQIGDLATEAAEVRISGSGNVKVNAAQTLDVQISGSGTVKYAGHIQPTRPSRRTAIACCLGDDADTTGGF